MKLFRHGAVGFERAGALDGRGVKRDLSLLVPDITPDWLSPEKLRAVAAIDLEKMPVVAENERIGAPTGGARQFIAIGLNYRKHAAESGMPIPKDPLVFNKAITCIQGPDDDVVAPQGCDRGTGRRSSPLSSGPKRGASVWQTPFRILQATVWPMTSRSATGKQTAAASGSRARASTRSGRLALGS